MKTFNYLLNYLNWCIFILFQRKLRRSRSCDASENKHKKKDYLLNHSVSGRDINHLPSQSMSGHDLTPPLPNLLVDCDANSDEDQKAPLLNHRL